MVAPVALITWVVTAIVGSTFFFHRFVKPRLPVYTIQIKHFPRFHYGKTGKFMTQLPTRVTLRNDNYLPVDVYALNFDLFYTDWFDGSLQYLGSVQDRYQNEPQWQSLSTCPSHKRSQACITEAERTTQTEAPAAMSMSCTQDQSRSSECSSATTPTEVSSRQPVWQIPPRAEFDLEDDIYLSLASAWAVLYSVLNLGRQLVRNRGQLILPSTGIAHVNSRGIAATVSMICDNVIHVFDLQVQGLECTLQDIHTGWIPLEEAVVTMREKVTKTWKASAETGGVFLRVRTKDGYLTTVTKSGTKLWDKLEQKLRREEAIEFL